MRAARLVRAITRGSFGLLLFTAAVGCGSAPGPVPTSLPASIATAAPLQPASTSAPLSAQGDAAAPIHVELSLAKTPELGDEVQAQFTISAVRAVVNTTATLSLPNGVSVIDGQTSWQGDLAPNQPIVLQATLRFDAPGRQEITGLARHEFDNGDVWADMAVIYLDILAPGQTPDLTTPTPPLPVPAS